MIAITGASGNFGRLVADALAERVRDPRSVTLGTRDPSGLEDRAEQGFRVVRADFDDPASLEAAFAGADTVLVISGDAPVEPRIRQQRAAVDAAKRAGVGRVVYTSSLRPGPGTPFPFDVVHGDTEEYIRASGLGYTILRNGFYAETMDGILGQSRETDRLESPAVDGRVAYASRADLAAIAATVLAEEGHERRTYTLTGPEAFSLRDMAGVLSEVRGRPVSVREVPPEDYGRMLALAGLPQYMVEALLGMFAGVEAGQYDVVTPDAEVLLGRTPLAMSDYVRRFA